jgi:hypothetical protein
LVTTAAEWRRHLNQQQLDRVIQSRQAAQSPSPIASPKTVTDHIALSPIGSPSPERFAGTPEPLAIPVDRFGRSSEPLGSPSPQRFAPTESRKPSPQRFARDPTESRNSSAERFVGTPEPLAIPVDRFVGTPEPVAIPVDRFGRSSPSPERFPRDPTESRNSSAERFVGTPEPLAIPVDRFGRSSPSPERFPRDPTESRNPSPQRFARDQQESPSPSPQRTASPSPERLAINPRESPQTSRSPDRLARNSQESASALPDPFTAPIQVDGDNRQRLSSHINDELEDDEDGVYETDDEDVAGAMSRGLVSTVLRGQ